MEQKNDEQFFLRPDQFLSLTYDKVVRHGPVSVVEAVRRRGLRAVGEAGGAEGGAGGGKGGRRGQGRVAWEKGERTVSLTAYRRSSFHTKNKKTMNFLKYGNTNKKCLLLLVKTFRGGWGY